MSRTVVAALALIYAMVPARAQDFSTEDLARRTLERRAVEAVIWGMPAVNLDLMLQAMIGSARGKPNQIVYWSRLPDWKNQTLTPNPDVIYLMPFLNTKDVGPMVLEIRPADDGVINGTIMVTSLCLRQTIRVMRCCARFSTAAAMPMLPRRSAMLRG
jgi:hypothetical protein